MDMTLEGAITAARRLFLHYQKSNNGNLGNQVRHTNVHGNCWSGGVQQVGVIESAKGLIGLDITVKKFPRPEMEDAPIVAMLMRYEKEAKIYVSENENDCHKRFYVAKELCHLLLDDSESKSFVHTGQDVRKLLTDVMNKDALSTEEKHTPALFSEYLAYLSAVELLLPPEFTERAEALINNNTRLHDIALEFKVPKSIIERRYLNDDIRKIFEKAHESHMYRTCDLRPTGQVIPLKKNK